MADIPSRHDDDLGRGTSFAGVMALTNLFDRRDPERCHLQK
jgi:hypothetical protein